MTAIQYNSIQNPTERDTRDLWAIRQDLSKEKQMHSELLSEVRELDKTIASYNSLSDENTGKALLQTVDKLNGLAGMTDVLGPGFVIEVKPSPESIALGTMITGISPELLTRFVNEINRFKGIIFEIDDKRFTIMSSIRDINGITTVNALNVSSPPFKIRIISPSLADSEKLYNFLSASSIHDDFYLDDLILEVKKPEREILIKGYPDKYVNRYLKELPKGE
jgi:uncharacterized protein YlxW (UPF0749 family)